MTIHCGDVVRLFDEPDTHFVMSTAGSNLLLDDGRDVPLRYVERHTPWTGANWSFIEEGAFGSVS